MNFFYILRISWNFSDSTTIICARIALHIRVRYESDQQLGKTVFCGIR